MNFKELLHSKKLLLVLILILAISLRFYNITNIGVDQWDEGEYIDAGESILEGKFQWAGVGLKPLHNAFLAAGLFIFGNYDFAGFAVVAIFGVLTVLLVYYLGKRFFDVKTGLLAAFILAITEYHVYFSRTLYSDVLATFFFSATILLYYLSIKKGGYIYPILTAILIGLSFMVRINMVVVLFVVMLSEIVFAIKDKAFTNKKLFKKRLLRFLIIVLISGAIMFSVYSAYSVLAPPGLFDIQFGVNTGNVTDSGLANTTFYLEQLVILGSPILLLAFLLGLYSAFESRKDGDIILLIWALSILLFFSFYGFKRYRIFLIALPAVTILAARGLFLVKKKLGKYGKSLFTVLVIFLAFTSMYAVYDTLTSSATSYREAAEFVRSDGGQGVIVPQLGIFQYYSDEKPLPPFLFDNLNNSNSKLLELYEEGYSHVIIDYRALRYNELAHEIVNAAEPMAKFNNLDALYDPTIIGPIDYQEFDDLRKQEIYQYVYVYRLADIIETI
ncbi:MAG: glycosyltransferase family 39 protein [Nanoarchaeota archaeon]